MDEKKAKKAGGKKDVKFEDGAPASSDLVFGATSGNDMVNFGGEDEEFGEAKREPNVIRKCHTPFCFSVRCSSKSYHNYPMKLSLTRVCRFALPAAYHT